MRSEIALMRRALLQIMVLLLVVPLLPLVPVRGAAAYTTYTVTRTDDPSPGSCSPGDCSLREAILAANATPGSLVVIGAGTFTLTRAIPMGESDTPSVGDLDITATTTISGAGSDRTIIDAGNIDRVFDIPAGPMVYIERVSLANGAGKQSGLAGVGQAHGHGGAIHNHGNLTLVRSTIADSAPASFQPDGGALYNAGGATALLENVTIARNTATLGGGIGNAGTLNLYNVTLTANSAISGGGLYVSGGSANLNNTISGANVNLGAHDSSDCYGTLASPKGSLIQNNAYCTFAGSPVGNITGQSPKLTPLTTPGGFTYLYGLLSGSPAIDAGLSTDCPSTDQRGIPREQDGDGSGIAWCDIGAYERNPANLAISYMADSPDPVQAGQSLIYTIDVRNTGPAIASALHLTNTLPAGVTYSNYAETRGGTCAQAGGVVTCDLATLNNGFVWTIYLYLTVNVATSGLITNNATVSGHLDPSLVNNSASEQTTVTPAPTFALNASATGGGGVTGDGAYLPGSVANLGATAPAGGLFIGWTVDGQFQGWANPLSITMGAAHTIQAAFAPRPDFPDVPSGHPSREAIGQLAARGIIKGYEGGDFGPDDPTLRAQMAALIARAIPGDPASAPGVGPQTWALEDWGTTFPDQSGVDADLWRNVGTLAHYNVAKGYADGSYDPTGYVLRVQTISFITRAMVARGYWAAQPDDPALYPNVTVDSGHRADIATYVHYAGALPGTTDTGASWVGWDQPATRAWFAEALWQALADYWGADQVP